MRFPEKERFILINHLTEKQVRESEFVIYAHACLDGVYVGMTKCPVTRWREHVIAAYNENDPHHDEAFKVAIRRCGLGTIKHYIVAVSNFDKAAQNKEAAAIAYYGKHLNTRTEYQSEYRDHDFRPLESSIGQAVMLKAKHARKTHEEHLSDSDRKTIIAVAVFDHGRLRLMSTKGQAYPAGLFIHCSRDSRASLHVGDLVKLQVSMTNRGMGGSYLVAAQNARFRVIH